MVPAMKINAYCLKGCVDNMAETPRKMMTKNSRDCGMPTF
jgi:hypothetical protein